MNRRGKWDGRDHPGLPAAEGTCKADCLCTALLAGSSVTGMMQLQTGKKSKTEFTAEGAEAQARGLVY